MSDNKKKTAGDTSLKSKTKRTRAVWGYAPHEGSDFKKISGLINQILHIFWGKKHLFEKNLIPVLLPHLKMFPDPNRHQKLITEKNKKEPIPAW